MSEAVRSSGGAHGSGSACWPSASTAEKDAALLAAADLLVERDRRDPRGQRRSTSTPPTPTAWTPAPLDRLRLTDARIAGMADGLRQVAALPDPVGEVLDGWRRPNGLEIERVRVPLGVVAIIYENRPNVTSDAAGICLKSGNAALLRGSAHARCGRTVAIADVLRDGSPRRACRPTRVLLVDDVRHEAAVEVMQLTEYVDCLIPRGGHALIQSIRDHADRAGRSSTATATATSTSTRTPTSTRRSTSSVNAKTQPAERVQRGRVAGGARGGRRRVPARVSPTRSSSRASSWSATTARARAWPAMGEATDDDFGREFLALKLTRGGRAVARRRDRPREPVRLRAHRGDRHPRPRRRRAGSPTRSTPAVVIVNASTRFTDGERVRLRRRDRDLHPEAPRARPDGLRELTTYKYVVWGDGQISNRRRDRPTS